MSDRKVMLVVADHARDAVDCRELFDMLGITVEPKRGPGRPTAEPGHGNRLNYYKGCRCDACRNANRLYQAQLRAKWRNDPASADRAGHGKATTYRNHGCRCEACTVANRVACAERRARRREDAQIGGAS